VKFVVAFHGDFSRREIYVTAFEFWKTFVSVEDDYGAGTVKTEKPIPEWLFGLAKKMHGDLRSAFFKEIPARDLEERNIRHCVETLRDFLGR
jgi:hypothetical protein